MGDRPDEVGLAHRRGSESDIGRWIFDQDTTSDRVLHLLNMLAHMRECGLRVRQRQQVVEIGRLVCRPGEMFRNKCRLIALDEKAEASEMGPVERLGTADRHAYPVQRNRMVATDALERLMRGSARAHVVLGVYLEKAGQSAVR